MKKYISLYLLSLLFFVFFPGIPSFCKDSLTYTSANEDSADPFEGIIFNLHFFSNNEYDNYATIENYANAKNVENGVFTIPTEITYEGITYPVVGVNSLWFSETIKEVIVPKDFGNQKLNLPPAYTLSVGGYNFFSLPNVPKVTIYAENINIADLVLDGSTVLEQSIRITSNKSILEEINIYSKTARIQDFAITDYSNLKSITFAEHTQLILDKYSIVNLPKLEKLNLPAKTKFPEGAISFCSSLKQISFTGESRYTIIPETGSIMSPSGTLLFVPSDTITYTTTKNTEKIGDLAFTNCRDLEKAVSSAKIIGEYAFMGCKNLETLTLTNRTKKIENFAFTNCGLVSFSLPKSVTSIGHSILYNNKNLKTITSQGSHYKCKNGALTTFSGKTLLAIIPNNGKVIVPNGVVTCRTAPVTAPLEVVTLTFPASLRNFYQMGQKMKNLRKVTFQSLKVPDALELYPKFRDSVILRNIGYNKAQICIASNKRLIFDIPISQKKAYNKFIKHICTSRNYVLI